MWKRKGRGIHSHGLALVQTYAAIEKPAGEQERTLSAMAALALRDYLRDRGLLPKDGK